MIRRATAALAAGALLFGLAVATADPSGAASSSLKAQAKKALIVKSDLPKGWTSSSSGNDSGSFPGLDQLGRCLGMPANVVTANPPTVYSPEFTSKNQELFVDDSVQIDPSVNFAKLDYESIAEAKSPGCVASLFNGPAKVSLAKGFGHGATIGTFVASRTPSSYFGPHVADVTLYFPVTFSGTTLNLEMTLTDYIKGRLEQSMLLFAIESNFPSSLSKHLTTVGDQRL
jgi:hypothetical protein